MPETCRYVSVFLDLDGTLMDSMPVMVPAFHAAASVIGCVPPDDATIRSVVGIPLPAALRSLNPRADETVVMRGVDRFRSVYSANHALSRPYPGMVELIHELRAVDIGITVVTLKPMPHAAEAIDIAGIGHLVGGIVAACLAETDTKADLVSRALRDSRCLSEHAVMVGDRDQDVTGAIANGVNSIGVLWGFGSRAELTAAGCSHFAGTPDDLRRMLIAK
jgi:phosphoglycolate phosphatase